MLAVAFVWTACAAPPAPEPAPDAVPRPTDFGAVGDGIHDDAPALEALFALGAPHVDLSGTWTVGSTVRLRAPPRGTVRAGTLRVLPGATLDAVVEVDLGRDASLLGTLAVDGAPEGGAWWVNRRARDGVHLRNANGARIERIVVDHVRRYAVRTGGGNTIGASLDSVLATYCGTSGLPGEPAYTRQPSVATTITRAGPSGGFAQRATLHLSAEVTVEPGDTLSVGGPPAAGGDLVEVVRVDGPRELVVYPWPRVGQGEGAWPVEVVAGGAVRLHGGNTAAMRIGTIKLQHGGHALHVTAGYGGQAGVLLGEVVGATLTVGSRAQTVQALTVLGPLHSEVDLVDVLVGGTGIGRVVVLAPTEPLVPPRAYHVVPTVVTARGAAGAPYPWPLTVIPAP